MLAIERTACADTSTWQDIQAGVKMARSCTLTWQDVDDFDGCESSRHRRRLVRLNPSLGLIICWFGVRIPAGHQDIFNFPFQIYH